MASRDQVPRPERKATVGAQLERAAEALALGVQDAAQPLAIDVRRALEAQAPAVKRDELEFHELAALGVELGKVHHPEIGAELFVARNPLVVVDEVAAAVEDQLAAADLDALRM